MGWLEKIGLVEREAAVSHTQDAAPVSEAEPAPIVDADIASTVNIVDDIYAQNELSDKGNSIYTVQALIDTLPSEMTTAKKQNTVLGILNVSGKQVSVLLEDAAKRRETLLGARDKVVCEHTDAICVANADIEELKRAIEAATLRIKENEEIIEATKRSVDDEITVIDGLIAFCNGMEGEK